MRPEMARVNRQKVLKAQQRHVSKFANAMRPALEAWMRKAARFYAKESIDKLKVGKSGKVILSKARDLTEKELEGELEKILKSFGLRHINATGEQVTLSMGADWIVEPSELTDFIKSKKILVKMINEETRAQVEKELRYILDHAAREFPKPSVGEIAKRITERFVTGDVYAFSPQRAALIARTESVQNESTAIYKGYELTEPDELEWVSSNNPNHGDRRHDLMNGQRVKFGEKFYNKITNNYMRYPGDPEMEKPVDIFNCGCGIISHYKDIEAVKQQIKEEKNAKQ